MASQTAHDLRTVVTRRVGVKKRVVVLASDLALVRAIEANGCLVLADPSSLDELEAFQPEVVVLFDGFVLSDGEAALQNLARVAGQAELVFSFANAASASLALGNLTGLQPTPAFSEPEVRRWLSSAGYVVSSRDAVITAPRSTGLSADTEAALRQLFEQLNPDAAVDRFLLVAKRGAEATKPDRTEGLVSVIVSGDSDVSAFEGTISSLANQQRRPLELIVVAPLPLASLEDVVARARRRSGLTVSTHTSTSSDVNARLNEGLAHAQGQYVAFAEAGALFAPMHFTSLVKQLEDGTLAWAMTTALSGPFSLRAWLEAGVAKEQWLLDVSRLCTFKVTFAEATPDADALLFARLSLLFPPAFTSGPSTVELLRQPTLDVAAMQEKLKGRPLRGLTTLEALLHTTPAAPLSAQVQERLASIDPRAAAVVERARGFADRVQSAWVKAKKDAEKK
ncbi:MAG: glycosyltransferase family A protein [Myxococcaceae bacterium]